MKRIFFVEWRHKCDSESMNHIFTFDGAEELFDFFAYEEDPLVYFAFEDITDQPIEQFERKLIYGGKYSM